LQTDRLFKALSSTFNSIPRILSGLQLQNLNLIGDNLWNEVT